MTNDADQEMFRLLSAHLTSYQTDRLVDDYYLNGKWDRMLALLESGRTTELGLLQTFIVLFQRADRIGKLGLIHLMNDLIDYSIDLGGYNYPELFWLVVESNLLFEFTDISDVGSRIGGFLRKTGGAQVTRSYLIQTLLSKDTTRHANAFMAFYATGHTLQSLRIVMKVAPEPNENNASLYVCIYADATRFLATNKDIELTNEDRIALKTFFSRGLTLTNQFAIDYCQQALAILANQST